MTNLDRLNHLLNEEFLENLLVWLDCSINNNYYEYIEVREGTWNDDLLFRRRVRGFIITPNYEDTLGKTIDKIKTTSRIELFNQLGSDGWKLVKVISEISSEYQTGNSYEIIKADTYRKHEHYGYDDRDSDKRVGHHEIPIPKFPNLSFNYQYIYIFQRPRHWHRDFRSELSKKLTDFLKESKNSTGRSEKKGLRSNLEQLLINLLKWKYHSNKRTGSWESSIIEHRNQILEDLEDSPSLRNYFNDIFEQCYQNARKYAKAETRLPLDIFPEICPFTKIDILNPDYFPED